MEAIECWRKKTTTATAKRNEWEHVFHFSNRIDTFSRAILLKRHILSGHTTCTRMNWNIIQTPKDTETFYLLHVWTNGVGKGKVCSAFNMQVHWHHVHAPARCGYMWHKQKHQAQAQTIRQLRKWKWSEIIENSHLDFSPTFTPRRNAPTLRPFIIHHHLFRPVAILANFHTIIS